MILQSLGNNVKEFISDLPDTEIPVKQIFNDLQKGAGFSSFTNSVDINALNLFNEQITSGASKVDAYKNVLSGCNKATRTAGVEFLKSGQTISTFISGIANSGTAVKSLFSLTNLLGTIFTKIIIPTAIDSAITAIDNYIHRLDIAKEKLSKTQASLKSIDSEILNTSKRIKSLESMDIISITDKNDLEELRKQNKELEIRKKYLEILESPEKEKVADLTKEQFNRLHPTPTTRERIDEYKDLMSEPKDDSTPASNYLTGKSDMNDPLPYAAAQHQKGPIIDPESLAALIAKYEVYQEKKKEAILNEDSKSITEYTKKIKDLELELINKRTELQQSGEEISPNGEPSSELDFINSEINLIDKTVLQARDDLTGFINNNLISESRNELTKLLSEGNLTSDILSTKFQNLDTYLKENGLTLEDFISLFNEIEDDIIIEHPFSDIFNSFDFSDTKDKLLELAKSGELNTGILESTEEYKTLLDKTGLSADAAKNNILDMLNATDKLAGAANGFDSLKNLYDDFEENGFVSASSLLSLPDVFKELEGYDLFSQIVGDPTNETAKIQQAFNDIATQYLISQNSLSALAGASESTIQSYIANLSAMGITNAEEVITQISSAMESESILINNAEVEYYNACLNSKSEAELQYLKTSSSNQGQLVNALGSAYSSDYENWCNLLSEKATAYNQFVAQANKSVDHDGNLVVGGAGLNNAHKKYLDAEKAADEAKNKLKLNLTPISTDFKPTFSPKTSNSSGSSPEKAANVTIEKFNFIERLLNKLSDSFDKLKDKGKNTFSSFTSRTKSYSSALKNISSQINAQASAYDAYMARANTVGLEGYWADQVQNGSLNIADITDDGLKQRIKDYKEWYEKARDCKDKIEELKKTQTEMTQSKIELLITKYDKLASKVKSTNSRIENKIDLKEALGSYASSGDYTNLNKNNRTQIKYINEQIKHYKSLQKTVTKNSEKWLEYKKEIDSSNESIQDLTKSITENAQALAELAGTKAKAKIETYDSADDLWEAKIENSSNYKTQNKYINEEVKNINKRQTTYNSAVKADKSGIASSGKAINKVKSTKQNKSLLKNVKSCIKKKEEIPASLLLAASKLNDNNSFYQKCIQYNAYVAAYQMDKATADLYKQESVQDKADKASQKQSNIETYYSNRQGVYNQKATQINNAIDLSSAKGHQVSTKYYGKLISNEKKNNTSLKEERQKLISSLTGSVKNGSIKKYSDEWYQLCQQIDDVTNAMDESNKLLVEYGNQMRQIKWDNFDYLENHIKNITSELDFMINELSREDLASDDTGGLTDRGNAVAALRASKYTTHLQQAKDYENEINKIEKDLAKSPYDKTLLERKQELIASYQEAVSGAQDEKYAIIELYSQGYDALSNKISDLISEYEDLLDAEKNAYDYQNNIADKAKEISTIRKQLEAYAGDASEEARAKVQSLNVSLADAERDLKDTQYDKFISDTKDMLSDLQSDFGENIQEIIDSMSQNFDSLMEKIESELSNTSETIKNSMDEISYKSTEEFSSLLDGTSIVKSTMEMISDTKNFHSKMESYVDGIAKSLEVTTASTEVNKKIQSDGAKNLAKDTTDAKEKSDSTKKSFNAEKDKLVKAEKAKVRAQEKYDNAEKKYGKNHDKTKSAKANLDRANTNYNNIKSTYIRQKSDYEYAKKRSTVLNYLSKHLDIATDSRGSYSDLNKAFYDEYGQRVLTSSEIKELAQKLKLTYDNQKESGTLYKELKEIGISGFKVGSRKIPYDQLAFLGEGKNEIQFDKNQGVLREVGQGDKIFTASMAENLWKLAQDPGTIINHRNLSPATPKFMKHIGGDVSVDIGDIVMHDVNNPEQFASQLVDAMNRNTKVRKTLVNNTVGTLSKNYNSLSGRRF